MALKREDHGILMNNNKTGQKKTEKSERLIMENKINEKDIILKTDDGITIAFDSEFTDGVQEESHKHCLAIKEVTMNYGILFFEDKTISVYSEDSVKRNLLNTYWNLYDKQITDAVTDAEDFDAVLAIGIAILVNCTRALNAGDKTFKHPAA